MPNYTYKCSNCSYKFDIIHGMNEIIVECPKCISNSLKKIPSQVNFKKPENENLKNRINSAIDSIRNDIKQDKEQFKSKIVTPGPNK